MTDGASSWSINELTPEARLAAERAATAAGMDVESWVAQLIKYTAAMERSAGSAAQAKKVEAPAPKRAASAAVLPSASGRGDEAPSGAEEPTKPSDLPSYVPIPPLAGGKPGARAEGPTLPMSPVYARASAAAAAPAAVAVEASPRLIASGGIGAAAAVAIAPATGGAAQPPTLPPRLAAGAPAAEIPAVRAAQRNAARTGAVPSVSSSGAAPSPRAPAAGPLARDLPPTKIVTRPARSASAAAAPPPAAATPNPEAPPAAPAAPPPEGTPGTSPRLIATDHLHPSRFAALASPKEDQIQAALDKWRSSGMLEPLQVRPKSLEPGHYEIICGIERWHAARRAYVRSIPAIVADISDREALETGLVDQLRRGPLSPLSEGNVYLRLLSDAGLSVEQAAKLVGKPANHVATMVRILNLPRPVRAMLEKGEITVLHARALLAAPNPEALARDVVEKRLDLFQTEQLVRNAGRSADLVDSAVLEEEDEQAPMIETAPKPGAPDPLREQIAMAPPPPPPLPLRPIAAAAGARRTLAASAAAAPRDAAPESRSAPPAPAAKRPVEVLASDVVSTDLLERKIAASTGLKCAISERGGVGVVTLHYTNREELARIIARMSAQGGEG
jgi:ParB/RepB/Spo0J family partition protein